MTTERTIDLRDRQDSHVRGEGIAALAALGPGESARLLTREDPVLLLGGANLHLRESLGWSRTRRPGGDWEARVWRIEDRPAADVVEVLVRDHRRLDRLLALAIPLIESGAPDAPAAWSAFRVAITRHVAVEDGVLAQRLGGDAMAEDGPLGRMLREHREIETCIAGVDAALAEGPAGSLEAGVLCGLLAGLLAKHEHREETLLFAHWRGALLRASEAERAALLARAVDGLAAPDTPQA